VLPNAVERISQLGDAREIDIKMYRIENVVSSTELGRDLIWCLAVVMAPPSHWVLTVFSLDLAFSS
jgi:hypothetical protein